MNKYAIFAPHGDDEIIGCHDVLLSKAVTHVFFSTKEQAISARKSAVHFGYLNLEYAASKLMNYIETEKPTMLFFPDPNYEIHPEHKRMGNIGMDLVSYGVPVIFYTTNMNAPYIYESKYPQLKQVVLNKVYSEKSDLWEYDHKYFLFEGYTQYLQHNSW